MKPRCVVPACGRPADHTLCGRCWKLVSPRLRLALQDHMRIAEGRVTGDLLSWLASPYEARAFIIWSWRHTLALAAWDAAWERSFRREANYEPFSHDQEPSAHQLAHTLARMP